LSWWVLLAVTAALALAVFARRRELVATSRRLAERRTAIERGSHKARLQYPQVDLSRCIGCGLCVAACPEEGVLEIVHGQALVVHGARCVGHGRCAPACPVGAIALTFADLKERRDLPALSEHLESAPTPGLFLAGEVTGFALVRTAIAHGVAVANEAARRTLRQHSVPDGVHDLVVVGAGPAGLACALQAKVRELDYVVLEQDELGGTVAKYPRRKLVMTQPVELPLVGKLERESYTKEELIDLWRKAAHGQKLPIRTGIAMLGVERGADGLFVVRTSQGDWRARFVCLALGRRGTPNKLGVPGEELPKVLYSLLDAHSYQGRRILVVGGGDSAVEAALGLAEQPGNQVSISYRREAFTRLKARNEANLLEAVGGGRLKTLFASEVTSIEGELVRLRVKERDVPRELELPNDDVFILAGGTPPFQLLEKCGVSFDPAARGEVAPLAESGPGFARALLGAFALAVLVLAWVWALRDYYALPLLARLDSPWHARLRPAGSIGLPLGAFATALIVCNLVYLARRGEAFRLRWGSLQRWMSAHVVTGVLALLAALVHGAMAPRSTVGGHALAALAVLVATGAIGRYFYAFVPRAANGRELALEELHARLATLSAEWDRGNREFGERVRNAVGELTASGRWNGTFLHRLVALITSQRGLRATIERLQREGREQGLPRDQLEELGVLARRAHRSALMAAHYEDLRALMASWRYFHRWVALFMVLILVLHIVAALRYASMGGAP
jgi:thioredoxin reductase/ferredoxin